MAGIATKSSRSRSEGPPIDPFSSSRSRRHVPWAAIVPAALAVVGAAVAAALLLA
ncbi:MAG: hypothetical protein KGR19_09300 [Acidobacteria bacterium]|nr:hypothetical protein [Acidobacteriota bacterium]